MKKHLVTIILSAAVVILAALLVGILIFLKNQPPQQRATLPLVEIAANEPDSSRWGINFPNQYDTMRMTKENREDTKYGGSSGFSWLERDPRQKVLFAGMAFSKDYNDDRGHEWALDDVNNSKRINEKSAASCYSCKSASNPGLWQEMGLEGYSAHLFSEMTPLVTGTIGCANCHEAGSMRLVLTNPSVIAGFESQGIDWTRFSRQQMRSVVCANCHVEYYQAGEDKVLTLPWKNGTRIEEILATYDEIGFKDWEYPGAGTPALKAQHPEYETFTANSTHYLAGVSCADCHMPYVRDGAAKFSSHNIRSPLINPEQSCGTCHTDVAYVTTRVNEIQGQVGRTKTAAEDALLDAIAAIRGAVAVPGYDGELLSQAREKHRQAQFRWDFVSAENSMGFHNPEYALAILAESTRLAREAQMLAAQAAGNPALLQTDVYYTGQQE